MIEIKFRAWIKKDKAMSPPAALTDLIITGIKHPQPSLYFVRSIQENASILMQYTGLKDKNGVEIYEGDIVKAASQGQVMNLEVKWGQGTAGFFLYREYGGVNWNLAGGGEDYSQEVNAEVIGNIYENGDLLK